LPRGQRSRLKILGWICRCNSQSPVDDENKYSKNLSNHRKHAYALVLDIEANPPTGRLGLNLQKKSPVLGATYSGLFNWWLIFGFPALLTIVETLHATSLR